MPDKKEKEKTKTCTLLYDFNEPNQKKETYIYCQIGTNLLTSPSRTLSIHKNGAKSKVRELLNTYINCTLIVPSNHLLNLNN